MTMQANTCSCLCHEGRGVHVGPCSCTFGDELAARRSRTATRVDKEVEPVLCYVTDWFAWFTTAPLGKQWGDDWGSVPYESNAGDPYDHHYVPKDQAPDGEYDLALADGDGELVRVPHRLLKLAWEGPLHTPAQREARPNSPYSVDQINSQGTAWLAAQPDFAPVENDTAIYPGATVREFITAVKRVGGEVYVPLGDSWRLEGTEAEVLV